MKKKLSLFACLLMFFACGAVYGQTVENVADGAELDAHFNAMTQGTLNITVDTITAVSSLYGSGKEIVFEGLQPDGSVIDLGQQHSFLNLEGGSDIRLNGISVINSSGSAITSSGSLVAVSGSGQFGGNVSYGYGGAFFLKEDSEAMFNGDFVFSNNTASQNGGAIFVENSEASFLGDLSFTDNESSQKGGAIYAGYNSYVDLSNVTKTVFSGNKSGSGMYVGGGALYAGVNSRTLFGGDVEFSNNNKGNTSNSYGGAVIVSPLALLDFTNAHKTVFDSNEAYLGGAIYIMNTGMAFFAGDTEFRNNFAGGDGGAIYNNYAHIESVSNSNIKFIGNSAENRGGVLFSTFAGETVFNGDVLFQNNRSTGAGGAVYLENESKLHFAGQNNIVFDSNISYGDNSGDRFGKGGALAVYNSTAIFDGTTIFRNNKSLDEENAAGGAVFLQNSDISFAGHASFLNNETYDADFAFAGYGGGFAAFNDNVSEIRTVEFDSTAVFDGNKAWQGAGFYAENAGITFADMVLFSSNTATSFFGMGGGFYVNNAGAAQDIKFEKYAEFRGNEAYIGGAFVINGGNIVNVSFEDALFTQNTALGSGGAFQVVETDLDFNGAAVFSGNSSAGESGAFFAFESSVTFNGGAEFSGNRSDSSGGAIVVRVSNLVFNNRADFSGNKGGSSGTSSGGAIAAAYSNVDFFSVSSFSENEANAGGAIYVLDGELNLVNSYFYDNTAYDRGGAIAAAGSFVSSYAVVNIVTSDRGSGENKTVFKGNQAAGESNAVYLADYSSMTFITNENASVEMYDKISADSDSSYITVSGAGKFNMGAGADIANLNIVNGNFYLRGGQTLNITNMNVSNGSVFNMADHSALPGGSSAGFNTLNVTALNLDGRLEVDGVNNDGTVNISAETVSLGDLSSLDVLTNITDKNYNKRIYKIFSYGSLSGNFGGVTINDGINAGDLSISNYFMRENNWLMYVLVGEALSTDFSSLAGLSYNSKQVAKLFDRVTESGSASGSLLLDIALLDGQAPGIRKQGLEDMSGYFIANVIRSAGFVNDNAEIYDRIKYQDFETEDMNGIWVQARGQHNKVSSDDNSPQDYKDTMIGFMAGWDKMFDEQGILIGAFAKYNSNSVDQGSANSADIRGFGGGIYSGIVKDEWELKALVSGNFDNFETKRKIRYLNKTADGEFDSFTLGFDIEFGVKSYVTENIYLKPFGGFETKSVMYKGFKEENAGDAGLDVNSDTYTRGMGRIGIGVASDDDKKLEWSASLHGKYLFMGKEPEIESEFLGAAGAKFKSRGAKEGNTLLGVSGGISYKVVENIKLYANAGYHISDSYRSVYGQVGLRYMFMQIGNKFKIMKQ